MTAPLDEKARDAALAAWFANTAQGWHAAMEAAIRAYLEASPSPSEMEVGGRDIYECANQLMGYVGPNTEDSLAKFLMREGKAAADLADALVQAQSALAAMRAERDEAWNKGYAARDGVVDACRAQVQRLTEENEALRELAERLKLEAQGHASEARTANSTIYEIYQVLSGGKGEPGNWHGAEPARRYVAAQREAFIEWVRPWVKSHFGKWITHNTARGAHGDFERHQQARTTLQKEQTE